MYTIKVHKKGIIVIPKEVRERLNIKDGDKMILINDEEGIHIYPIKPIEYYFGKDKRYGVELIKLLEEERNKECEEDSS